MADVRRFEDLLPACAAPAKTVFRRRFYPERIPTSAPRACIPSRIICCTARPRAASPIHGSIRTIISRVQPRRAGAAAILSIDFLSMAGAKASSPHPLLDGGLHGPAPRTGRLAVRMRFVILHYHFLKNAGMSIESILHRSFGSFFSSIDTPERDGHITEEALLDHLRRNPQLKAVSSHQIRYPVPHVAGFLFFDLCFLRDPFDRIRSIYDYFREKPSDGDPVSDFANRLPLGGFLAQLDSRKCRGTSAMRR